MRIVIVEDDFAVATTGAKLCSTLLQQKPHCVLGLATGSTPVQLYQQLIQAYQRGDISFAGATSFNLDEYIGLPPEHPQSYRYFMEETLFRHIDIASHNTHLPDGMRNPHQAADAYEQAIVASGGIDLQILGLGRNGHIGFNEPFSSLGSRTRVKTLSQATLQDNRRFFADHETSPTLALTMGIATIMASREIMLLAIGKQKAEAVCRMVEGALSAACPASILQMHPKATIILDQAAASHLQHAPYYQYTEQQATALAQHLKEQTCTD